MVRNPDVTITLASNPGDLVVAIERNLLASLAAAAPQSGYAPLALVARGRDGTLLGGLVGSTSYGWLLIKMLWVTEAARGCGLGTRMMEIAEDAALSRGCHGAWLDTSSDRARGFYERLGYEPFGILENMDDEPPEGHRRFFMHKRLTRQL
jgi:GNAT superfamily N-acetyltransferase